MGWPTTATQRPSPSSTARSEAFSMRCACLLLLLFPSLLPAQARKQFTDVTAASGLKIADNTGVGGTNPHAVAVEDFDGDGKFDIIVPTFGKPHVRYFRNLGGLKFRDV